MTPRLLLAALLGAVGMFVWAFLSHDVLPLGTVGMHEVQNEAAFLAAAKDATADKPGMYFFPAFGLGADLSGEKKSAAMKEYEQKVATNPSGIMIYVAAGAEAMTPKQLIIEFLTEFLEVLLGVWLLSMTRAAGFGSRLLFFAVLGGVATLTTNVPYWNWYAFPSNFTCSQLAMQEIAYIVAGAIVAAVGFKKPAA